jgi:tetraacyldisaccharide 4'-kinase
LNPLSAVYGRMAEWRRGWHERHPEKRRRLDRAVISVGSIASGGTGKTPVVVFLASHLVREGERPVILSRGYARRSPSHEVVVVSDGGRVLEPAARSGDEPQMMARALPDVPVVVAADRHRAGLEATRRFAPTVFLLDDGFQHLKLARDVDLVIVSREDLVARVLPAGPLRESIASSRRAHALLVPGTADEARRVAADLGVATVFHFEATTKPLRSVFPFGAPWEGRPGRAVAVAGIARPGRFFAALRNAGWDVVHEISFRDHHWFDERDLAEVERIRLARGADLIVTTEKDAVRLDALGPGHHWTFMPMDVRVDPDEEGPAGSGPTRGFSSWLRRRLEEARERRRPAYPRERRQIG